MLANMQQRFSCEEKDLELRHALVDAAHRLKPTLGETPTWEEVRDEATK